LQQQQQQWQRRFDADRQQKTLNLGLLDVDKGLATVVDLQPLRHSPTMHLASLQRTAATAAHTS
jgi:hypothetical protein